MSLPAEADDDERPSGGRELLQIVLGVLVFALVGPLVLGVVLFLGVIVTSLVADVIDWFLVGRRFDPATSMVVATGLMLLVLRFGWMLVIGALVAPPASAGAILGLRRLVFGSTGWKAAVATGVVVGLLADIGVVSYGAAFLGPLRIGLLAGWVVIGSIVATLSCWRVSTTTSDAWGTR